MSRHYDKDTINQIRQIDMTEFLSKHMGFTFKQQGSDYRCIEHNSLVVRGDKMRWFWNSRGIGGSGAIDFMIKIEHMSFIDAIEIIQGKTCIFLPKTYTEKLSNKKVFSLPEKDIFPYTRLTEYLCKKRCIDEDIISDLIFENKIYQDKRGNVVFVGYDENNKPRFASLRGTGGKQFRMDYEGSDKNYNFSVTGKDIQTLYIFESPIDMLSYLTIQNIESFDKSKWREYSCLSLSGISNISLDSSIKKNNFKRLVFCLDNDNAGQEAVKKMSAKYLELGFKVYNNLPENKDFNEDLILNRK